MTTDQINEKVRNFIKETTFSDASKLTDSTLIFKEGYFDSMGFVSLIAFIEEEFGVQTEDEDLIEDNFESVIAITTYVKSRSASAA